MTDAMEHILHGDRGLGHLGSALLHDFFLAVEGLSSSVKSATDPACMNAHACLLCIARS